MTPLRRPTRWPGSIFAGLLLTGVLAKPVAAAEPSMQDLLNRINELQRRVDELEGRRKASAGAAAPVHRRNAAHPPSALATSPAPAASAPVPQQPPPAAVAGIAKPPPSPAPAAEAAALESEAIPGLLPAEPMGSQIHDALRSDLPGLSLRIPHTDTQVRLYGFTKLSAYTDLNGRNQSDAPAPSGIPLIASPADRQGGDFGMTARFSRVGVDTRTLTSLGTLETRIEGDFGGGAATSNNAVFRLRQAWAELGNESFRVLVGQANSLWNEGVFETLIDATNLNQSFIRQAQIRVTGRLAPGLQGQVSLEAPDTQYTSVAGIFTPGSSLNGGASPAFNSAPDLLGRLTYRENGMELDVRGLLRQLSLRTSGTAAAPPSVTRNTPGWGIAAHARVPMRWLSEAFGADQLMGMAYYGEGIGRYFAGNTSGQDALSTIGLPGTTRVTLNAVPTYGVIAAYRRFWTAQLRSNVSYAYAWQDYPSYALGFTSGSTAATSLNRDMQQVFVNLIWSPFAELRNGVAGTGWLDVGLEYLFTRRDVFGGSHATGSAGNGFGTANRFVAAAIARF